MIKNYTKKEDLQVIIITLIALLICFAGSSCRTTLCEYNKNTKNVIGYK